VRPLFGVVLELVALSIVLYAAMTLANLYPLSVLILVVAQALTTILVHCPAHYVVGRALGIRFSRIGIGRSTATKALPKSLKRVGSLLVVFTLRMDSSSRKTTPPTRLRLMFLAGVSASLASAFIFALAVGLAGNYGAGLVAWIFAIAYLASDILLSPKTGDVMRARAVIARR
jgi:hypothetical protein